MQKKGHNDNPGLGENICDKLSEFNEFTNSLDNDKPAPTIQETMGIPHMATTV
jgi:hypothetical protein